MDFLPRDSDSDYAFRLQMEEALAASLSYRSQTPQRPPLPPIVARCGIAIIEENDQNESTAKTDSADVRLRNRGYGFDFRKSVGEGNSKGKGKIHKTVTGVRRDDQNPNFGVGNFRNTSGNDNPRPSPVLQSQGTVRPAQSVGEGSSRVNDAGGKFNGNVLYRLYFKGLVSEDNGKGKMTDVLAGFGVAICDQRDHLLFETKGPLIDNGLNRQAAELKALIRGLNEALKFGIKHIAIFCDSFPIFQYARGRYVAKQKKISLLLNDLQRIMQQFSSSQPLLVAGNDVKFAYKLARESIVSKVTPHVDPRQAKAARKEECVICYNDTAAERMFSVDKCCHRFCFHCVKQHVEVKLLHGMVPKCPHYGCKSELVIDACGKLLTPKLIEMWKQRIKENAIPVTERVYCPYPRCSTLMSKTKISESAKSLLSVYPNSGFRRCVECHGLFCVDCKLPWHGKLSCTEYKKLHPNSPADDAKLKSLANNKMWRQCGKCQHMIELTHGCYHITCRCGFEFCYQCGGEWNKKTGTCTKRCPAWSEEYIMRQDPAHEHLVPNFFADDGDDDDDEDEDSEDFDDDDEDEDYEDFDDDDEDEDYKDFDDDDDDEDYEDFDYDFGKLSCIEYKKLHPNSPADDVKLKSLANNKMWRQCGKCQYMIELTHGCNHITCRCGFEFCYQCGGEWNKKTGTCTKRCPVWNEEYIMRQDPAHEHLVPNFFADEDEDEDEDEDYEDFDDDDEDEDEDEDYEGFNDDDEDEDYEDFDYD